MASESLDSSTSGDLMVSAGQYSPDQFGGVFPPLVAINVIATIAVLLRIYTRTYITRNFGISDVVLIMAHVLNVVAGAVWLTAVRMASFIAPESPERYSRISLLVIITLSLYVSAGISAKISIAHWFYSVARSRTQRYIIITPLAMYLLTCLVAFPLTLFRCGVPVSSVRVLTSLNCRIGVQVIHYASWVVAVLNSFSDWVFATVPLYMVITAQSMSRTSRVFASMLIGVAIAGSVLSIARLPFLGSAQFGPGFLSNLHLVVAYVLSLGETACAITAISLVTLRPLLLVTRRNWQQLRTRAIARGSNGSTDKGRAIQAGQWRQPAVEAVSDMMQSWEQTDKKTTTKGGSMHMDSRVLGGIGILPNVTCSSLEDDEATASVPLYFGKNGAAGGQYPTLASILEVEAGGWARQHVPSDPKREDSHPDWI